MSEDQPVTSLIGKFNRLLAKLSAKSRIRVKYDQLFDDTTRIISSHTLLLYTRIHTRNKHKKNFRIIFDVIAGSLKIIGDPSEFGNIELRLKENDSPVSIIPFSKNLSLVKQLDKEVRRVNL